MIYYCLSEVSKDTPGVIKLPSAVKDFVILPISDFHYSDLTLLTHLTQL